MSAAFSSYGNEKEFVFPRYRLSPITAQVAYQNTIEIAKRDTDQGRCEKSKRWVVVDGGSGVSRSNCMLRPFVNSTASRSGIKKAPDILCKVMSMWRERKNHDKIGREDQIQATKWVSRRVHKSKSTAMDPTESMEMCFLYPSSSYTHVSWKSKCIDTTTTGYR